MDLSFNNIMYRYRGSNAIFIILDNFNNISVLLAKQNIIYHNAVIINFEGLFLLIIYYLLKSLNKIPYRYLNNKV